MKPSIHAFAWTVSVAGLGVFVAPVVQAQTAASAPSRTEVKADTKAAQKSGQLMPAGEGKPQDKPAASTKTRAERKAETQEARKQGQLKPPGQAMYDSNMSQSKATAGSTKTRAERKQETQQAAKDKKLMPAGEAGDAPKK
jgi:hypothetical protein